MATKRSVINLTQVPETVTWPKTHYVFIEKIGPFQDTAAQAWQEMLRLTPEVSQNNQIKEYMSLYKVAPKIYRAGVSLDAAPKKLPAGLIYESFRGGKYSRFVLTGPYSQLPEASGRVFEIVSAKKIRLRDDFCIEHYLNDPKTTPEDQLATEILVPTL